MTGYGEIETFSTGSVEAGASLATWRRYMSEVWFRLDIATQGDEPMAGALRKRTFAQSHVSWLGAEAQRVVRSRQAALDDVAESFCLVFPTRGTVAVRQHGRETQAAAGDVYLLNANEAYEVDLPQHTRMLCLTLPCDLLRSRIGGIDDLCGTSGFSDPVMVATLRQLMEGALEARPGVEAGQLEGLCLTMIDMMVVGRGGQRPPQTYSEAVTKRIVAAARRTMGERLADADLGVAAVAAEVGTSVRQLQLAFQRNGTTFQRELLELRLDVAREGLRRGVADPRRILDVSTECGFATQSYFSTKYRARFGLSPREEKATATL